MRKNEKVKQIEGQLTQHHRNRQPVPVSDEWKDNVMSYISGLEPQPGQLLSDWETLRLRIVWRFSAATAAASIIATVLLHSSGLMGDIRAMMGVTWDPFYAFTTGLMGF